MSPQGILEIEQDFIQDSNSSYPYHSSYTYLASNDKNAGVKEEEKNFTYPNRYPINNESIGIEVVGKATDLRKLPIDNKYPQVTFYAATWDTPAQAQRDSIKNLIEILKVEYNLSNNDIYAHDDISPQKTRGEAKGLYEKE